MINAACLPKNQAFPAQLTGDDELAYLDKVLAETARLLRSAEEHRQAIIGMVAHDLRSPLMAAQASLEMFEEIGIEFTDETFAEFQAASDNLSGILNYVHELLSVQKRGSHDSDIACLVVEGTTELCAGPNAKEEKHFLLSDFVRDVTIFFVRPKVMQKGLMLVLLPLIFQTSILLLINRQIVQGDKIVIQTRQLSDNIMDGQLLQLNMVRASIAEAIYIFTSKKRFQQLSVKIFGEITALLARMETSAAHDANALGLLKVSRKVIAGQEARIMAVQPSDPPDSLVKVFEDISEVNTRSPEAWKLRRDSSIRRIKEKVKLQEMDDQRNDSAELISQFFGWSILANFILAIGLLLVFNRDFHQRLNGLVNNASKLGTRQHLKKTVKGNDEFAILDLALHNAENEINIASERRSEMMNSLAQEMRKPLIDAKSHLGAFARHSEETLPPRALKCLHKAQRNIDRVLSLIENLLTMESLSVGKVNLTKRQCNTATIAEEALATVSSLAQKKNIAVESQCEAVSISADDEKLVQVLVNLLGNAIKFSDNDTLVQISSTKKSDSFRFAVQDHGPGMDEETRRNVFEKFYQAQTAQKEQGFGMGLAICKLIVESHAGTIGVDSSLGCGTTFWLELPVDTDFIATKQL